MFGNLVSHSDDSFDFSGERATKKHIYNVVVEFSLHYELFGDDSLAFYNYWNLF